MSKFAKAATKVKNVTIKSISTSKPDAVTHEGGAGWSREPKSELFLLAVTNFVGENTFYEKATDRDARFENLVHQVTKEDPEWVRAFVPFLRKSLNMRTASLVAAAEYIKAGGKKGRSLVSDTLARADEPAEILAYWLARHGRKIPKPLKRGVADSVQTLYTEYNALKWDGTGNDMRMGDVIDLTHPEPRGDWQSHLFKLLIDERHGRDIKEVNGGLLKMITARRFLNSIPVEQRREHLRQHPKDLEAAGMTWESISGWIQSAMDAEAWEAAIPNMGYMALLRNLRNFDDAKISGTHQLQVKTRLMDHEQIAKSRQFPFRFYSAFKELSTLHWGEALEAALNYSLQNIPVLEGKTLILVDMSGSMRAGMSGRSKLMRDEAAALFGAAIATRSVCDLVPFANTTATVALRPNASVLKTTEAIAKIGPSLGGGTETAKCLRAAYNGHDRVIILTDEQAFYDQDAVGVGIGVPLYTFNLAGYSKGHTPSGVKNRYTFGGLTDAAFSAIPLIEAARGENWSFMTGAA